MKMKKENKIYNSNIIKNVNYTQKMLKGNEYIINAAKRRN